MLNAQCGPSGWTIILLYSGVIIFRLERVFRIVINSIPYRACHTDVKSGTMLFVASAFNGIFRMDFHTGEVKSIGIVSDEKIFQEDLYGEAVAWGRWLVLLPLAARELAVLDRETGQCVRKIKLLGNEEKDWKFAAATVCGNDMILIPACYPCFLSLNMLDFSVTVLQDWKEYLERKCLLNASQLTVFTVDRQGNRLYLQVKDTDCLLQFDLEEKRITRDWRLPEMSGVFALCDEKNVYVIPGKNGRVLCMNTENGKIECSWPMPVTVDEHTNGYVSVHGRRIGKKLVLFPQTASRIGVIDLETGETGSYVGSWSRESNGKPQNIFQKVEMLDERYVLALVCHEAGVEYACYRIDIRDFSDMRYEMHIPWDWQDLMRMSVGLGIRGKETLDEQKLYTLGCKHILGSFLAEVGKREGVDRQLEMDKAGKRIYQRMRKEIDLC